VVLEYQNEITKKLQEKEMKIKEENVEGKWNLIKNIMLEASISKLGYAPKTDKTEWFDDECRELLQKKNQAYREYINKSTRQKRAKYLELRIIADKICRRKKRQMLNDKYKRLEEEFSEGNVHKAYKEVKEIRQGLLGSKTYIKSRWQEYFSELLNPEPESNEEENREDNLEAGRTAEDEDVPTQEEAKEAIRKLRACKTPGIDGVTSEMIKSGGSELIKILHNLIIEIWKKEEMPKDWRVSLICPKYKKGDKKNCNNYRGI